MRYVVFNQKGGVGKSTITCNLAAISAHQGWRTLVVDLDVQGNSTRYLLGQARPEPGGGVAALLEQSLAFSLRPRQPIEFVVTTAWPNLGLMPSSPDLDELHGKLESRHKIYKLRDALVELSREFDRIYIDTPPALNFYTRSALIASQRCLIPFDCDDFSRQAVYTLLENVREIQADHNRELQVQGIVVNQFQPRAKLPQRLVRELVDEGLPVLEPYLSSSVKVKESHDVGQPLIVLDPAHKLTQQFVQLHERLQEGDTAVQRRRAARAG